jgi:hypothetical protein
VSAILQRFSTDRVHSEQGWVCDNGSFAPLISRTIVLPLLLEADITGAEPNYRYRVLTPPAFSASTRIPICLLGIPPALSCWGNNKKIGPLACPRNQLEGHSWTEMTRHPFLLEWMGSIMFSGEATPNFGLIWSREGPGQAKQRSVCSS